MSVWSTKTFPQQRNYIVIKHNLPGINNIIMGIKFRGGYAVVEKDSKSYFQLKKLPVLKSAKEFSLDFLRELPFITRSKDILTIFGRDVYSKYVEATKKVDTSKKLEAIKEDPNHCKFQVEKSISNEFDICGNSAVKVSPSNYCLAHLLQDSKLKELGIELPLAIPKKQRYEFKQQVINKLEKLKKENKF